MQGRHRAALAALFAGLMFVGAAPLALAGGHMTGYHATPEHDDGGRSNEPDQVSTGVLGGGTLTSCNIDTTLDGQCEVFSTVPPNAVSGSRVLAPGCWDNTGKQPSGTCYLALRTGGAVGTTGMTGNRAPGAFTPNAGTSVRFLDNNVHLMPVRAYVDHNAKLADSGLGTLLSNVEPNLGRSFVPTSAGWTAWYGTWQDKNGNGVIDYLGSDAPNPTPAGNEFVWIGECGTTPAGQCITPADKPTLPMWFFPGNHHAFLVPEVPGMTLACFLTAAAQQGACTAFIEDIDEYDNDFQGDPLLGPQNSVQSDINMDDRTDNGVNARHWAAGNGFPLYHYDQSLVVREIVITAANPGIGANGALDPATAKFRDVDSYTSWSPVLEGLLQNQVKPAARGQYEFVRDAYVPFNKYVDRQTNNAAFNTGPLSGAVDDMVSDPGFGHEPNDASDNYPGASRGTCSGIEAATRTHWGFCNSYAGYQSGKHAFADAQLIRSGYLIKPSVAGVAPPLVFGPQAIDGGTFPGVRADGDHRRALGPGFYDVLGSMGLWQDKAHAMSETYFDPEKIVSSGGGQTTTTLTYTVGKDGWVGNIVQNTGMFRYRGYQPEVCTVYGVTALYEHAVCDPYNGGATNNPQDYGSPDGEFDGRCLSAPTVRIRSASGTFTAPTFVYRNLEQMEATNALVDLEDWTGRSGDIVIKMECIGGTATTSGLFVARDQLLLPAGSLGMGLTTIFTSPAIDNGAVLETVVDVDRYAAL